MSYYSHLGQNLQGLFTSSSVADLSLKVSMEGRLTPKPDDMTLSCSLEEYWSEGCDKGGKIRQSALNWPIMATGMYW